MKAFVLDEDWKGVYVVFAENKEDAAEYIMNHSSYNTFYEYIVNCIDFDAKKYILENLVEVEIEKGAVIRSPGDLVE